MEFTEQMPLEDMDELVLKGQLVETFPKLQGLSDKELALYVNPPVSRPFEKRWLLGHKADIPGGEWQWHRKHKDEFLVVENIIVFEWARGICEGLNCLLCEITDGL